MKYNNISSRAFNNSDIDLILTPMKSSLQWILLVLILYVPTIFIAHSKYTQAMNFKKEELHLYIPLCKQDDQAMNTAELMQ